ncbi:hypothetical protein ACI65C_008667 [Semiaphis heraclei]
MSKYKNAHLNEAYKKLKQAEDTSELSNVESFCKKKLKRRLKSEKESCGRKLVKKPGENCKSALTVNNKDQSILTNSPPKYDVYKKKIGNNNLNDDNGYLNVKHSSSKTNKNNNTEIEEFNSVNKNRKETIVNNIKSIDQTENKHDGENIDKEISSSSSDNNDDSDADITYEPFIRKHSPDLLLSPVVNDPVFNYKMNNNMSHQNVDKTSTPVGRKRHDDLFRCSSSDNETHEYNFVGSSLQKKKKLTNSNLKDIDVTYSDPKQNMTTKIDRIEERQTNMMLCSNDFRCSNSGGDILHTNSIDETWNFPLTSFDELDGFEQMLLDDGYKLKVVKKQDTYLLLKNYDINMLSMTREILAKLFHNDLLAQFSYVGQKGKKVFSVLNTCSLLFAAVRSVKNYKNCTDIDIIRPLKPYLANATARGKQKRKD